jgi:ADP-ribosylglycohydrolase
MSKSSIAVGLSRAVHSLHGLSTGDAFGQRFFVEDAAERIAARTLPKAQWTWTDDTEMAISIVEELGAKSRIDADSLAQRFVARFDEGRGYGGGAQVWMRSVALGTPWKEAARSLFDGQGSYGNGGAMRAAPIGAFFAGDPKRAADEALLSACVTHAHQEGQAGAMAVAAAASLVSIRPHPPGKDLLLAVLPFVPPGPTREGIEVAATLDPLDIAAAARRLGTGSEVSSADTVPFALFCAAHHLTSYEAAMWATVSGLGDRDTTCAIVGGIVIMTSEVPLAWLKLREPLPDLHG